ncbi:MAG: hypothetical protein ACFCUH_03950 [Flavobacteriales bacterium]
MFRVITTAVVVLLLALGGCTSNGRKADTTGIEQQIEFVDLNALLAGADFNAPAQTHQELYQTCNSFWEDYTEYILQLGPANDAGTLIPLRGFLDFDDTRATNAAIQEVHTSRLADYEKELDAAFRRYRYFFPNDSLPDVVWYNSGFNYAVYPTESHLGIGLEFFLGPNHPIVENLSGELFPTYLREKMHPALLVPDALRGWLLVHYQDRYYDSSTLVSTLMYWGKMMYLLDLMLPETADHLKMAYTAEQQAWCKANERNLWIELSQQEILFESRQFEINRWVADGPFTRAAGIPQEAPSRVGIWLGWRVVRDFVERNPDMPLEQLLANTNYTAMLNAYRPQ